MMTSRMPSRQTHRKSFLFRLKHGKLLLLGNDRKDQEQNRGNQEAERDGAGSKPRAQIGTNSLGILESPWGIDEIAQPSYALSDPWKPSA